MRFFFKTIRFKVISAIALILVVCIVIFGVLTDWSAPQSSFLSAVLSPFQKLASSVSGAVGGFFDNLESSDTLNEKIDQLEEELAKKDYQLIEYEDALRQNEFYKDFLEIKENNPSFQFASAVVIARDTSDPYGTFTIDKGTLDGVSVYDPVITAKGIVGYISDAYSTQSTVMTVLNPSINISVLDNRTRDSGNVSGDMSLAGDMLTKMSYISRNNTMAAGDYIITSGAGGVFPAGQIVGTVKEIKSSDSAVSYYAVIEPAMDISSVSDVMIITDFEGQSSLAD